MTSNDRKELAMWTTEYAQAQGATDAAVTIGNSRNVEVEVREEKVETIKESTQNSLTVKVYVDGRFSAHSTNNLKKNDLERFISEAVSATKYLAKDPARLLTDPSLYPTSMNQDLMIFDENAEQVTPEKRLEIANRVEATARAKSEKVVTASAGFSDSTYHGVQVHSNGFVGESKQTSFWTGGSVTVKDGEARPSGFKWGGVCFFNDMPSPESLGEEMIKKALQKIGQEKIKSGKYDMIVDNTIVPNLLNQLLSPMSAAAIQQKTSFLSDKKGQQIASKLLTMVDDPFIPKSFGSQHFDSEGIAAKKRTMIENGVLKDFYINNYYGKKLGWTPNGGSTSNLTFADGDVSFDVLVAGTKKGIIVTSINGGNSNATTGDFSFGISGLLVENGIVIKPVNEMNVTGNSLEFWKRLTAVGNDPYNYSPYKTPTMVFSDIDFSGL